MAMAVTPRWAMGTGCDHRIADRTQKDEQATVEYWGCSFPPVYIYIVSQFLRWNLNELSIY